MVGGTVAATAAAWAVSGASASAAEHPILSSHATHSSSSHWDQHSDRHAESHAAKSFAKSAAASKRATHKFVARSTAEVKSTVDSAGKPLDKTVRTTVKNVGTTAWDTLNALPKVHVENTNGKTPSRQDMRDAAHRFGDDSRKAGKAAVSGTAKTVRDLDAGVNDTLTSVGGKMADDSQRAFDRAGFDKIQQIGDISGGQRVQPLPMIDGPTAYPIDNLAAPAQQVTPDVSTPDVTPPAPAHALDDVANAADSAFAHSKSLAANRHLPAGGLPSSPVDDHQNSPAPLTMPGAGGSTGAPNTVGGALAVDAPSAAFLAQPGTSVNYRTADVQIPATPGKQPGTSPD